MQIIPAIDVLDGRVVRLRQGDFDRVTDFGNDPLTFARRSASAGASRLHVVNLSGAKSSGVSVDFLTMLRAIAAEETLQIQVGGGIRSLQDVKAVLDAGAAKVVLGTMLFTDPASAKSAVTLFGADRVIAALDVRGNEVRMQGWQRGSGFDLTTACCLVQDIGIREILVTDVALDGMEQGPNVGLYRELKRSFPSLRLIASGGVRGVNDIENLSKSGCDSAVIGRAFVNGDISSSSFNNKENSEYKISPELTGTSGLAIRIIPCLDIDDGRVVKGVGFQNLRDAGDPVALAKRYCEEGADELVFLDISATHQSRTTLVDLVSCVADAVNIPFTVGGGVRTVDDARALLNAGADKVAVNSAAVADPSLLSAIASELGSANTVCAIDARRKGNSWTVLIRGGRDDAEIDAVGWAMEAARRGAGELLVTSFDRDGTGEGFDTDLLARIKSEVRVPVIASGGAGSLKSIVDAVRLGKADAVLAASIFHFGTFSVGDVKRAFQQSSFPIRL